MRSSRVTASPVADAGEQGGQAVLDGVLRALPDLVEDVDQLAAEGGELGAAMGRAADMGVEHRPPAGLVERVDQQPGAPVGHADRARGGRDRAMLVDRLQQGDLAGTDLPPLAEVDLDPQARLHAAMDSALRRSWEPLRGSVVLSLDEPVIGEAAGQVRDGKNHVVEVEVGAVVLGRFLEAERVVPVHSDILGVAGIGISGNQDIAVLRQQHGGIEAVLARDGPRGAVPEVAACLEMEGIVQVVGHRGPERIRVAVGDTAHAALARDRVDVHADEAQRVGVVGAAGQLDVQRLAVLEIEQGVAARPLRLAEQVVDREIVVGAQVQHEIADVHRQEPVVVGHPVRLENPVVVQEGGGTVGEQGCPEAAVVCEIASGPLEDAIRVEEGARQLSAHVPPGVHDLRHVIDGLWRDRCHREVGLDRPVAAQQPELQLEVVAQVERLGAEQEGLAGVVVHRSDGRQRGIVDRHAGAGLAAVAAHQIAVGVGGVEHQGRAGDVRRARRREMEPVARGAAGTGRGQRDGLMVGRRGEVELLDVDAEREVVAGPGHRRSGLGAVRHMLLHRHRVGAVAEPHCAGLPLPVDIALGDDGSRREHAGVPFAPDREVGKVQCADLVGVVVDPGFGALVGGRIEAGPAEGDLVVGGRDGVGRLPGLARQRAEAAARQGARDRGVRRRGVRERRGIEHQVGGVDRHAAARHEGGGEGDHRLRGRMGVRWLDDPEAVDRDVARLARIIRVAEHRAPVGELGVEVEDLVADVDPVPVDAVIAGGREAGDQQVAGALVVVVIERDRPGLVPAGVVGQYPGMPG